MLMQRHLHLLAACAALQLASAATAAEEAVHSSGVLTIPRVDSAERAGQFQSVRLERQADDSWRLVSFESVPSPRLHAVRVDQVEVVKTASFPVVVYLRASGIQQLCGHDGAARVHQRRVDGRFEVAISVRLSDFAAQQLSQSGFLACTADARAFKVTTPLPVYGLAAGTHAYVVNGVAGSFTLERENVLAGDCDAGLEAELRRCL